MIISVKILEGYNTLYVVYDVLGEFWTFAWEAEKFPKAYKEYSLISGLGLAVISNKYPKPTLMLGALAANSQNARLLFISRFLNPESRVII
jgi:hypothetical protein